MTKLCIYSKRPLLTSTKTGLWVVRLCVLVQFALDAFIFGHFGGSTVYSKRPPPCFKKRGTNFCIYSKRPPPTSKKAVTTTKEPIKWPNSVFTQNAPLLLSKNELTTRKEPTEWPNFVFIQNDPLLHKGSTKFCIYSKRPPPTSRNAVTTTMEHKKWTNFVFIQNAPLPTSKKAVTNFTFGSKSQAPPIDWGGGWVGSPPPPPFF